MGAGGLFGDSPMSVGGSSAPDTSRYLGQIYTILSSSLWSIKPSDFSPEDAKSRMDHLADRVRTNYAQSGNTIEIGQYQDEEGSRRLALTLDGRDFLSLVHTHPGPKSRRGTIGIRADTPSAEPNYDPDVRQLLRALGAKL